jgi:hypothetical protein
VFHERLLQRIETSVGLEAFDGLNGFAVHPRGEVAAGVDGLAFEQYGACAAFAAVAADLGAGEVEVVAESFSEGPAIFDLDRLGLAVDGQANGGSGDIAFGGLGGDQGRGGGNERGSGSTDESAAGNVFILAQDSLRV